MMTSRRPPHNRAFSLVEVLIAVLVLALGLLGLGAVFPTVVHQQRQAQRTTLGLSAREGAKKIFLNNRDFRPGGRAWPALREYHESALERGEWVTFGIDPTTSEYRIPAASTDSNPDDVVLPLAQRLYPLPFTSDAEPRFVWDLAARLVDPANPSTSDLMVVLFVRSIDPGIQRSIVPNSDPAEKYSLAATLVGLPDTGDPPGRDRRFAVSTDKDGRALLDGRRGAGARYSLPVVVEITLPGTSTSEVKELAVQEVFSADTTEPVADDALGSVGQRFLDRRGYLYRVTRVSPVARDRSIIEFDPPFPDFDDDGSVEPDEVNPIVFVPQGVPVDPLVFTFQP